MRKGKISFRGSGTIRNAAYDKRVLVENNVIVTDEKGNERKVRKIKIYLEKTSEEIEQEEKGLFALLCFFGLFVFSIFLYGALIKLREFFY